MHSRAGHRPTNLLKQALLCVTLGLATVAAAETGSLRLSTFPQMGVADGRSTITISAEVRDNSGSLVPEGTQVIFQSTLGTLRQTSVTTSNGYARALLEAPGAPGIAKVTATAIRYGATATLNIEFLSNSDLLERSREYVEVVAPSFMQFSMAHGVLEAAGENRGVAIRFGEMRLEADRVQVNLLYQELRARKARLRIGGKTRNFDELYFKLDTRKGAGTTAYDATQVVGIAPEGRWFRMRTQTRARQGLVEFGSNGEIQPVRPGGASAFRFEFEDISDSYTMIAASKVVAFPQREIQFHRAEVLVDGARALKLPLFQLNLRDASSSSFGEQIFTFNDSRLGIDYPHYMSLKPGETSLLRFRTGQRYGRSVAGSGGAFLDYELNWSKGFSNEGGLVVSGLARSDWSVDVNQYLRFSDGSSVTALLSSPAHRSVFGSVAYAKPFDGFSLNLSSTLSRSLAGPEAQSEMFSAVVEKDPMRLRGLPLTLHYGLTASDSRFRTSGSSDHAQSVGLRLRGQFDTFQLSKATQLSSSFSVSRLWSASLTNGLSFQGNAMLRHSFGELGQIGVGYELLGGDALESHTLGRQRLSFDAGLTFGNTRVNVFGSQSLDADWSTLYLDGSYRVNDRFRLSGSYTLDHYLDERNRDSNYTLWHKIGAREIGLTWSSRTNRLGIQFLGAVLD